MTSALPRVGFVGLGKMGVPICRWIISKGFKVEAYARNQAGIEKASLLGLATKTNLQEIAAENDVIVTSISNDAALLELFDHDGSLQTIMKPGQLVIETSTVSPKSSIQVHAALTSKNIRYLRCPVSGNPSVAEAGQLTIIASGDRADYDYALPLLQSFSKKQYYVGDAEQARYLKLTLNSLVGATSALLAEALALGRLGGLSITSTMEVVNNSAVASPLTGYKTKMLTSRDYNSAFSVSQMMKDFDLILTLGKELHCPLPLMAQIRQMYESAYAAGEGERDFFVLVERAYKAAGIPD